MPCWNEIDYRPVLTFCLLQDFRECGLQPQIKNIFSFISDRHGGSTKNKAYWNATFIKFGLWDNFPPYFLGFRAIIVCFLLNVLTKAKAGNLTNKIEVYLKKSCFKEIKVDCIWGKKLYYKRL